MLLLLPLMIIPFFMRSWQTSDSQEKVPFVPDTQSRVNLNPRFSLFEWSTKWEQAIHLSQKDVRTTIIYTLGIASARSLSVGG